MEQTLKITLTADNRAALAGLSETITAMNGVTVASGKTGAAVGKMGKDFTGITRVIQDLPYGFNAISNNLEQLVPAAGRAGIAFSGLIAALTFASIGFGAWTRGMSSAKKETEDFTNALKQENDTAGESISKVRALVAVAQDQSLSLTKRKLAVRDLQDQYPEYFKSLTTEKALTEDLTAVTSALTAAIYKRAEARARETDIAQKATKVYDNQKKLEEIRTNIEKQKAFLDEQKKIQGKDIGSTGVSSAGIQASNTQDRLNNLYAEQNEILTENSKLQYEIASSQIQVNKLTGETINLDSKELKVKKDKAEKVKEIVKNLEDGLVGLKNQLDIGFINENTFNTDRIKLYTTALEALSKEGAVGVDQFTRLRDILKTLPGSPSSGGLTADTVPFSSADYAQKDPFADLTPKRLSGGPMNLGGDNSEQAKKQIEDMLALQQTQAATITNLLTPAFDGLFQAMANGQNIGDQLAASFKQIVVQLTSMVIKALIFKAILSALKLSNPVTAGIDAAGSAAGGIGGALSIIGLLRGQDLQLMLDRTGTGMGYRRGG